MKIQQTKLELTVEGTKWSLEREEGDGLLIRQYGRHGLSRTFVTDVNEDGNAFECAKLIISRSADVPMEKVGSIATNSEIRDLADLLVKIGG